jgi:hypothetical protein
MASMLAAWEWLMTRTYVALGTTGVELRQLGIDLRAAWPDVAALSLRRGREGFVLNVPLEGAGAARLAALRNIGTYGAPLYDEQQRALLAERRFIPIEAFAWHARRGTLAQEVLRLAPHVRVGDDSPVAARASARALAWTALVVAVAIGAGLALGASGHAGTVATIVYAVAAPSAVLGSGISAWRSLRSRAYFVGGLFVAMTLVTLGWTMIAWQGIAQLLGS